MIERSPTQALLEEIDRDNAAAWNDLQASPSNALKASQATLAKAQVAGYRKGCADAHLNIGWCEYHLGKLADAYTSYGKSLALYDASADNEGSCKALNAIGVYYHEISRLDKSIDFYTQSLERAKKAGLLYRQLVAMANIGDLCLSLGNPKEALDYLLKAYEMRSDDITPELALTILINIGKSFFELGNNALALEFSEKALALSEEAHDLVNATEILEALARIATAEGRFDDAEKLLKKALGLYATTKSPRLRAQILVSYGELLLERSRFEEAVGQLEEAIGLCEKASLKSKLYNAYGFLARALEALGRYEEALAAYKTYSHFQSELQREDTAHKVRSIQVQAEIERAQQESEIYRLRTTELKEKTDALERMNRQMLTISELGRKLTASLNFKTVSYTLLESLKNYVGFDFLGLALYDEEKGQLVYRDFYEDGIIKHGRSIGVNAENSFSAWCFRNRKPILIRHKDEEYDKYLTKPARTHGRPSQSILCQPLLVEDRILGCLMLQHAQPDAYDSAHVSLVEALAPYLAIAVENSLIHDRLQELNGALSNEKRRLERATLKISHLANHDTLTNLPNRRLLFELMNKAMENARRTGAKIAVAFIDLDDFKPVNDLYGHTAGDSALVAMSERIKNLLRASDIVARVGGDEFIAVLTNARNRDDIKAAAEKLIEGCSRPIHFSGYERSFSFSMGIAVYPDDAETVEDLINKADTAMYCVKRAEKHAYAFSGERQSVD